MLNYSVTIEPDDNGTFLITCPALPEVSTYAESGEDIVANAGNAIEEAAAARMSDGLDIPSPFLAAGEVVVRLPLLTSLKIALYRDSREQGVTRAELMRRLGWHREQVDRLFRLDHASRLDQIEAAFGAIGREVDVEVKASVAA